MRDSTPNGAVIGTTWPDTIVKWVARGVEANADATAVSWQDEHLSYTEFDALTNRIADHLHRCGVRRGDRVGLCVDRSIELVASLVGILKAGAAYVPLDPTYPRDRLQMMCEDAALTAIVAGDRHADWIGDGQVPVHAWSTIRDAAQGSTPNGIDETAALEREQPEAEDVAFVIFTSGSTGRPKGVEMPHRALANLVGWQLERETFRQGARELQYSSISFDVSLQEIATTLASGGHLHMIADDDRRDPRVLLQRLRDWRIERLYLPFVALRSLVEVAGQTGGLPDTLTEIITAGEQLRIDDMMRTVFAGVPGLSLDNQYGPSETHVITAHLLTGDPTTWPDLPPIGRPLPNCRADVLDERMANQPSGVVGEIYLGGVNLAHGYIGRDDLTAERFVIDPSDPTGATRLYRTGDLGIVDESGELHYRGRTDHQVKIRGHRIEPGEINSVAGRLDGVANCLTHTFVKPSGAAFLVSYYTTRAGASVEPAELRAHLRSQLPEYMVPAFAIHLDAIELGPSGKANLQALPDPRNVQSTEAPTYDTDTERRLGAIWSDVLGFPHIPVDADFFDLGGDSLAAVTLFLRISEEFDVELPLASLTQASTIASLATRIDEHHALADDGFRSLQLLQQGSSDVPPLFLLHGGAGNVLIFTNLAAELAPDQAVYAFQWSGWDGRRAEHTISDMAAAYQREMQKLFPEGPYRIGGHCIGGLIAIELANRLRADGFDVDGPLIISDSPNVRASSYRPEEPDSSPETERAFMAMVERVVTLIPTELRTGTWRGSSPKSDDASEQTSAGGGGGIRGLVERMPGVVKAIRTVRDFIRIDLRVRAGGRIPMGLRERYCTNTMVRAARRHRPSTYDGPVLYLRACTFKGETMALSGWWDDLTMGFEELCTGPFELVVVGGYHNDTFTLPSGADIVRRAFVASAAG